MKQQCTIDGVCDPVFTVVRGALTQNLGEGEKTGESVSVVINGKTVVDRFCGNRMAPIADMGPYAKRLLQATDSSV
jgi:hypothetical protein